MWNWILNLSHRPTTLLSFSLVQNYAGEIWKRDPISGHFGFVLSLRKFGQGNHLISSSSKAPCSKYLPPTLKRKSVEFKLLWTDQSFRKDSFSWRISVPGGLTVEVKLHFQISPMLFGRGLNHTNLFQSRIITNNTSYATATSHCTHNV